MRVKVSICEGAKVTLERIFIVLRKHINTFAP